jgi:hypothetical protein
MVYHEVHCHICRVTFNISRFRTKNEPRSAAWHNTGDGLSPFVSYEPRDYDFEACKGRCFSIFRETTEKIHGDYLRPEEAISVLNIGDDNYEPVTGVLSSCPDEYDSNYESELECECAEKEDSSVSSDTASERLYHEFTTKIGNALIGVEETDFADTLECFSKEEMESFPSAKLQRLEHVPSHDCEQMSAYNGNAISAEAMLGCNTAQCLVRKTSHWKQELDDEDFEVEGRFFLSGLSDKMPSTDMNIPSFFPPRHGIIEQNADNYIWDTEPGETAMPFHPTCLEIFKRASIFRDQVMDLDGLEHIWFLQGTTREFGESTWWDHATDKSWAHRAGDEYLAANPCLIPSLDDILGEVQGKRAPAGGGTQSMVNGTGDVFLLLPPELRLHVLRELPFKDIASLRCASCAFRSVPGSFFRQLVLRDMPWFYEAWCLLPLSYWATKTATSLREEKRKKDAEIDRLQEALKVLQEERAESNEADLHGEAIVALQRSITMKLEEASPGRATKVVSLDNDKTDWYRLRALLEYKQDTLPGLKNRKRIWEACEGLLERMEAYRKSGRIPRRE